MTNELKELIRQMTLEEKASLCSGANFWETKPIPRLGIPAMTLSDGPHGVRKQSGKGDHLGLYDSIPATCYPSAAGLANTWDEALIEQMGEHLGLEAASMGVNVLLGPGVNIKRSPLCGRNFEYFSEDPYLAGKLASALIRGVQSNGISACVKHYAANSQELRRMSVDSVMDERTLREIYLPAFEMAVKEGGVNCLMTSYNRVNGEYANESTHLLQDILYGEWGYEGMVVTDWGGNNDRVAGLIAGDSLEMPSTKGETDRQIVQAVREGRLDEAILDRRVEQLLELLYKTKEATQGKRYDKLAHHAFAREVAAEAAVLLKNEGNILPLDPQKSVAVIGDFAKTPRFQGAGSSRINPTILDTGLEALKDAGVNVVGYEPGFVRGGRRSERLIRKAVSLAQSADIALLYLGLDEGGEAEGVDRPDMRLPENQIALLHAVEAVNPNVVVVLSCGCAVEMEWDLFAKGVLHAYLGGQAGASAVAELLTGKRNPSGKLSETIPLRYTDTPSAPYWPGTEATAECREGLYVGYRYFDTAGVPVKYPFGHGLSYTEFAYSDLLIAGGSVTFTVKNVGKVKGAEVAQLYVSAHTGGMFRPRKELKGFARVELAPGEERLVEIQLHDRSFAVWSVPENAWVVEPGDYDILIGASSADIRLQETVSKHTAPVENPYVGELFDPYYSGKIQHVSDESFSALLGYEPPARLWDRSKPMGFNDTVSQGAYLKGGLGKGLYSLVKTVRGTLLLAGKKQLANDVMFAMNLPYRGIARMSGLVNDEQMTALLKVINRQKGGWREFVKVSREKRHEK